MGGQKVINLSCYNETDFFLERILLGTAILPLIMCYCIMKTAIQSYSSFLQQIFSLVCYELTELKLGMRLLKGDISNKHNFSAVLSQRSFNK